MVIDTRLSPYRARLTSIIDVKRAEFERGRSVGVLAASSAWRRVGPRRAFFDDFDPRRDDTLTVTDGELSDVERNAQRGRSPDAALTPDDVDLDVTGG